MHRRHGNEGAKGSVGVSCIRTAQGKPTAFASFASPASALEARFRASTVALRVLMGGTHYLQIADISSMVARAPPLEIPAVPLPSTSSSPSARLDGDARPLGLRPSSGSVTRSPYRVCRVQGRPRAARRGSRRARSAGFMPGR
jgi:hypothetical protein